MPQTYTCPMVSIVKLPCNCQILTDHVKMHSSITKCAHDISITQIMHPINWVATKLWNVSYDGKVLSPETVFAEPVTLRIPNITDYVNQMTDITSQNKKSGLYMKKLSRSIKSK